VKYRKMDPMGEIHGEMGMPGMPVMPPMDVAPGTEAMAPMEEQVEDPTKGRKLFIGGLSWDTTDPLLKEYFEAFGELEEAMVVYNRTAGVSRGFGFVTFQTQDDAEKCLALPHKINGKTVEAKIAVHKGEQGRQIETMEQKMAKQVFVGGLPPNTTSDQLKEWAQIEWGAEKVRNAIAVLDLETKVTRGFGFVNFTDPAMVPMAISGVGGREYFIGDKKVEVKRAQMRDRGPGGYNRGYNGGGGGGRGRGRGRGRGGRGHQNNNQYGNYQQQQYGGYGQQYGAPGAYGGDQYGMSVYSQYSAPGSYMGYPQGPQGQPQAYGTPAQMQAMYSGMAAYGQAPVAPTSGPKATPQGQGMGAAGVPQGSAALQDEAGMMRSFEQMTLGAPTQGPMGNQMYSQAALGTQPYPPQESYSRAAYGMGAPPQGSP